MRPSRLGKMGSLLLAALCMVLLGKSFGAAAEQAAEGQWQARSVWDGAFTEEQAKRGEALYRKNCAACHGSMLTGGETASALTGGAFLSNWNGLPMDDLFERIRRSMPQARPGNRSGQVNPNILASVLSFNKFPAGKTELPVQIELLKQIRFESNRPEPKK